MNKFKKGFTLIELLVVVAIIGILASVVLSSLNSARNKGADAAVKANLSNTRAQAEIYYDTNGNYTGVCAVASGTINMGVLSAVKVNNSAGTVSIGGPQTAGNGVCNAAAAAWAAQAPLKANHWCVDSTGAAKENPNLLGAGVTVCP